MAQHLFLAPVLGDLGHPLSWEVAEKGGSEGELLRVGTMPYHSHIPVPRMVPGTNEYQRKDQISKGSVTYRKLRDKIYERTTAQITSLILRSLGLTSGTARFASFSASLPQAPEAECAN